MAVSLILFASAWLFYPVSLAQHSSFAVIPFIVARRPSFHLHRTHSQVCWGASFTIAYIHFLASLSLSLDRRETLSLTHTHEMMLQFWIIIFSYYFFFLLYFNIVLLLNVTGRNVLLLLCEYCSAVSPLRSTQNDSKIPDSRFVSPLNARSKCLHLYFYFI